MKNLMMFASFALIVTAVIFGCNGTPSSQQNVDAQCSTSAQYSSTPVDQKIAIVKQHIVENLAPPIMMIKYMQYDDQGEPFEYWNYDGGRAFQIAAEYYAMYTLDFDVSVGEIVAAGFWPYDLFPADMNYDLRFHTNPLDVAQLTTDSVNPNMLKLDEQEYLLRAKDDILQWFHRCYFFEVEQQHDITAKELASKRIAEFWINPLSGELMQERPGLGDYQYYDLMSFACCAAKNKFDYSLQIPAINRHPTYQASPAGKSASDDDTSNQCCVFKRLEEHYMGLISAEQTFQQTFEDVCDNGDTCAVTFTVNSTMYIHTWYVLRRHVPCDDPGPLADGEILLQPGLRAPDSIYGWAGDNVSIDQDTCRSCLATSSDPTEAQRKYLNFIADLTNGSDGGAATAPGPLCE